MTRKQKLEALLKYYETNRQVGHTTAMMSGACRTKALLLANSAGMGEYLESFSPLGPVISLSRLDTLANHRLPLLIDNAAMVTLLGDALNVINELEAKLAKINSISSP